MTSPLVQTAMFVALNMLLALILWKARAAQGKSPGVAMLAFGAAIPALSILYFFSAAEFGSNDKSLSLQIRHFQVPFSGMSTVEAESAGEAPYFVVGEDASYSDLVVPPYADRSRAAEIIQSEPRPILEVYLSDASGASPYAFICRYNYPVVEEFELPGWRVNIEQDDEIVSSPQDGRDCSFALLETGESYAVSINRLEAGDGEDRLFERRSFAITRTSTGISVRLDTPIAADIGNCDASLAMLLPGVPITDTDDFVPQNNLRPPQIGAGGAHPLLSPTFLGNRMPANALCDGPTNRFEWPYATGEDWRVAGTLTQHSISWYLFFLVAITSALVFLLRIADWRRHPVEACLVLALQWLLSLRCLIGVAGLYNDPGLSRSSVLLEGSLAFVCLPLTAIALLMSGHQDNRKNAAALGVFAVLATFGIAIWVGIDMQDLALLVVVGALLLLASQIEKVESLTRHAGKLAVAVPLALAILCLLTGAIVGALVPFAYLAFAIAAVSARILAQTPHSLLGTKFAPLTRGMDTDRMWKWGFWIIVLAAIVRFGLALVGLVLNQLSSSLPNFTERVAFLPLSAIYQPALIVGFALLLVAFSRSPSWNRGLLIVSLWGVAQIGIALWVRDFGMIWIYAWAMAFVLAWLGFKLLSTGRSWPSMLLIPTAVAPLAFFALAYFWSSEAIPEPSGDTAGEHMATSVAWAKRDYVRLMRFAAPEKVELLGNRYAFEMLDQAASLEPLVRGFEGRGYLSPSNVRNPIRQYQYSDNLSAIHIMWPFGRAGAIGLLVFLGVGCTAIVPLITRDSMTFAGVMSAFAGVTVVWAGLYMVMANLNLVPFTGRNIFLLASDSGGDAIEGLILFLLMALPWALRGPAREEQSNG